MSKLIELCDKYEATGKKMGWKIDRTLLEKVAKGCGPSIYRKDASLVAASDKKELERVKKNFLIKKLGMKDTPKLDEAIATVCTDFKGVRQKPRALFYYRLVVNLRKKAMYN